MRRFHALGRSVPFAIALAALSPMAAAQQILEICSDSLTTYLPGATAVNEVRPLVSQRGVNIDGSWRSTPGMPMQIAGNASENAWTGKQSDGPLRIDVGAYAPMDVDISLPTSGLAWVVGRTFNSSQLTSGGSSTTSNGPQGVNWMNTSMPEIVLYEHSSDDSKDVLYLVYGADRFVEYQRITNTSPQPEFKGKNGAAGVFQNVVNTGAPDTFTLTDQVGNKFVFFGFDGDSGAAAGQLWKMTDPAGTTAYVGHATDAALAISSGYDACGGIKLAYDGSDHRFTYAYATLDGTPRITQVKAEVKDSGTWTTPTNARTAVQADYTYYGTGDSNGDVGNLKTVTITTRLNDDTSETINQVKAKYYRYYTGTYAPTATPPNPGHPNTLKLVVDFEGCRRYDLSVDSTLNGDYLGAGTDPLKPYSSAYLEYDSAKRVNSAVFHGQCGCGGGSSGAHTYTYEANGSYSDTAGYQTTWAKRTIIAHPDGSYLTQVFDETSQGLTRVISDGSPSTAASLWVTEVVRDSSGFVTEIDTPESVSAYTHSTNTTTVPLYSSSSPAPGLIWTYSRTSSGDLTGFMVHRFMQKGRSAVNQYYESSQTWDKVSEGVGSGTVYRPLVVTSTKYPNESTSTTGALTTTYAYTTYSADSKPLAIRKVTTTAPAVAGTNNGPNTSLVSYSHLTLEGKVDFEKRADSTVAYRSYQDGQAVTIKQDADTGSLTLPVLSGSTPDNDFASSGTPLNKTTTQSYSKLGYQKESAPPTGVVQAVLRTKLADERLVTVEYPDYGGSPTTYYGPGRMTVYNQAGKVEVTATIAYSGDSTTTAQASQISEAATDPLAAVTAGSIAQMTVNIYDDTGSELLEERRYFAIPSSGAGTEGTHYDSTRYAYDEMGRRTRTKEASGTIRRTTYDVRGQVADSYIGTNDASFPDGESSGTDNMVKTEALVYDGSSSGKNGHVTQRTLYVEDSTTGQRVTTYLYDWRGRRVVELPPLAPYTVTKLDNLGRSIAVGQYSSSSGLTATTDPVSIATNRMALSETLYDELGRGWKSIRHEIDPADGSSDDTLVSETWYDAAGRVVKVDGEQLKKTAYDRLGRVTSDYILAVDNDTTYADADDVTGDVVLEQNVTRYSQSRGYVILRMNVSRFSTDHTTTSPSYTGTTGALYPDSEAGENTITLSSVIGRPQITSYWYDRTLRLRNQVQFGTSTGSTFTRNTSDPTTSTAAAPLTITNYNTDGTVDTVENPNDIVTKYVYDALGRRTKEIRNYNSGVNSGNPSGTDDNVTVRYEYVNGLRTKLVADVPTGGTDQETVYTYGTTKGASAGDSKIATGHLLQKVTYPDSSSSTDVVTHAYNAQGEEIWKKDQAGNVYEMDFDARGRQTQRRVTTLASGFDGAVRRIGTTYDSLGRTQLVTQYDNATVGSGAVTDEVKYTYDGWGNLRYFEQDRDSAVGASGSVNDYEVQYQWAKATTGRNTIRKTKMFLPSGDKIGYVYSSTGGSYDSAVSRVTEMQDDARVVLARYAYNGAGHVVGTEYPEPQVMWNLYSGTGTTVTYPDLDAFNRVVKSRWTKDLSTDVDFYHVELTYDRNSNIVTAEDGVHSGFDVLYSMDDVDRLIEAKEGTLSWSGSPPTASISSPTRDQQWTLSHTGNWDENKVDLNGDLDFADTDEENDTRAHNAVNEIGTRNSGGISLAYDATGNMADDGVQYEYEWDAFYRLRKVKNTTSHDLIAEYRYNGLGHRIAEHADTDTDGDVDGSDVWFYDALDEQWRQVARFRASDATPKEEFVPHQAGLSGLGESSYIDHVAVRQRDMNTAWGAASDGVREDRIYYCQNWRADITALVSSAARMLEWTKYSVYGVPFGLPAGDTDSDGDCDTIDQSVVENWTTGYDVRADMNVDGVINSADASLLATGTTYGRFVLSGAGVRNRRGFEGQTHNDVGTLTARRRNRDTSLGGWLSRDPIEYHGGPSLFAYVSGRPVVHNDPFGLAERVVSDSWVGPTWGRLGGTYTCTFKLNGDCCALSPCSSVLTGCTATMVGGASLTVWGFGVAAPTFVDKSTASCRTDCPQYQVPVQGVTAGCMIKVEVEVWRVVGGVNTRITTLMSTLNDTCLNCPWWGPGSEIYGVLAPTVTSSPSGSVSTGGHGPSPGPRPTGPATGSGGGGGEGAGGVWWQNRF